MCHQERTTTLATARQAAKLRRQSFNEPDLQTVETDQVNITPTPINAALAGAFSGVVMPMLWSQFGSESFGLVVAFLLIVALPAHAFVVGFSPRQASTARTLDTALLKRVCAWLGAAGIAVMVAQAVRT